MKCLRAFGLPVLRMKEIHELVEKSKIEIIVFKYEIFFKLRI